jgi:hypothetical protein
MTKETDFSLTNQDGSFKIITKRPESMSYEDYKIYMRAQKKAIKKYLKGTMVHLSKLYPTPKIMQLLQEKEYQEMAILLHKGRTYIKPEDNDSNQ